MAGDDRLIDGTGQVAAEVDGDRDPELGREEVLDVAVAAAAAAEVLAAQVQAAAPLDIWTGESAFFLTLVILVLTPVGMYLWMRRRAWM